VYLTFQEYFEKPMKDAKRWGKPLAALLGALDAQKNLEIAAIGGKDSMSGTFENIDVPPTLVSFAVTTEKNENIISPEFKAAGNKVVWIKPEYDKNGLPVTESLLDCFKKVTDLIHSGKAVSAYTPCYGGIAEAVMKMGFGNGIGFKFDDAVSMNDIFGYSYGSFIVELATDANVGEILGYTTESEEISYKTSVVSLAELGKAYEDKLEKIYSCNIETEKKDICEKMSKFITDNGEKILEEGLFDAVITAVSEADGSANLFEIVCGVCGLDDGVFLDW